jgi:hypothetical protein
LFQFQGKTSHNKPMKSNYGVRNTH